MTTTAAPIRHAHRSLCLMVLLACALAGCTFRPRSLTSADDVAAVLESAPSGPITTEYQFTPYEDPGRFKVEHGFACTQADRAADTEYLGIRIPGHADVPTGFNATVFLNGWEAAYDNGDHHVMGIGAAIFDVRQQGNTLLWNAGGLVSDENGDDPFHWCYHFTVVMWSPSAQEPGPVRGFGTLDVDALVSGPGRRLIAVDAPEFSRGPLLGIPASYDVTPAVPHGKLLMGFALSYAFADHHVLQMGLDYGRSVIAGHTIKWVSKGILQDANGDDSTRAMTLSTLLTGRSVTEWQPTKVNRTGGTDGVGVAPTHLHLQPRSPSGGGVVGDMREHRENYSIPNVPFHYAVPMLTAWDLGYVGDDHHVREAGAYIENFRYDRAPHAATGTLFYTVVSKLDDDSNDDANSSAAAVTVLGLDLVSSFGSTAGGIGQTAVGEHH